MQFYNDQIAWAEKYLETTKETYGEESEEYQKVIKEVEALKEARSGATKQYEEDAQKLKETVYRSLREMQNELIESGYDIEEDAEGIYESINEQLGKIGLDTEIAENIDKELTQAEKKVSQHEPVFNKVMGKIKNIITMNADGTFSINFQLNANYSELKNKLSSMRKTMSRLANIPVVGSAFKGYVSNLDSLINQLSVAGYSEGGFPVSGEMFLARENGIPEMVGRIGNKTAVANNGQIVEAVKAGVYEAVVSAMSQNRGENISLEIRADEGIIVKKASQGFSEYVRQTGELPFPVPL